MIYLDGIIQSSILTAWIVLILSFVVLFKSADIFVESSVCLAEKFRVPKLVIGIVLVSLATTAPELAVSLTAALKGIPEMALGNAVGSVICDDGLALGLAGLVSATPIAVIPSILAGSGIFLVIIQVLTYLFIVFDCTLNRTEGIILVLLFIAYIAFLFYQRKKGRFAPDEASLHVRQCRSSSNLGLLFLVSLAGIVLGSRFIVSSATAIAHSFHLPEVIIAMTVVAFGTSLPEIATCITAARKGQGAIAVGNILGADIMNICWVAGASAIAHDLVVTSRDIAFMFPSMFVIVGATLVMLWRGHCLTRKKGAVLVCLYILYLACLFILFPQQGA